MILQQHENGPRTTFILHANIAVVRIATVLQQFLLIHIEASCMLPRQTELALHHQTILFVVATLAADHVVKLNVNTGDGAFLGLSF